VIKILLFYIILVLPAYGQITGSLNFEKSISEITEGDPLLLELALSPIAENTRVADKLIGQNIIDSFNVVNVISEERDEKTSQVKLILNAVLFKKYEKQNNYEIQLEGLDKVDLHVQDISVTSFEERKEEVMVLDQPYVKPWNWRLIVLIFALIILIALPLIIRSVKKYRKINLEKKNKLNEIRNIETLINTAKTRDDIEKASELLKKSLFVEKDSRVKSFLNELERIQYKREWSSEDLRIFLSRLKEIKVI
jgi:hypothetical protein